VVKKVSLQMFPECVLAG